MPCISLHLVLSQNNRASGTEFVNACICLKWFQNPNAELKDNFKVRTGSQGGVQVGPGGLNRGADTAHVPR